MILDRIRSLLEKSPNQKAKAIASEIGCSKTEVNQVLYANQDIFAQDPVGFGWSLTTLRIDFGSNCWLTAEAFEKALTSSGSPLDSSVSRITFVIGEDCKILLEALARMLAICNQLADTGKHVSVDFQSSGSTLTYLNRIGFIDLLRSNVAILPKRPRISAATAYGGNNDGVVELRKIDHISPDDDIPGLLRNSFVSCAGDQYNVAAHTVISELFGNVKEHSRTQSAGLQNYPRAKRHHIQTVISDSGRGIAGTLMPLLERKYPQVARKISKSALDHRVALLQEVFSAGGLSQVDDSSRGLGLKGAGTYAQKYNALISVRQQDFELRIRHVGSLIEFSHSLDLARIEGTHICFDFFLD